MPTVQQFSQAIQQANPILNNHLTDEGITVENLSTSLSELPDRFGNRILDQIRSIHDDASLLSTLNSIRLQLGGRHEAMRLPNNTVERQLNRIHELTDQAAAGRLGDAAVGDADLAQAPDQNQLFRAAGFEIQPQIRVNRFVNARQLETGNAAALNVNQPIQPQLRGLADDINAANARLRHLDPNVQLNDIPDGDVTAHGIDEALRAFGRAKVEYQRNRITALVNNIGLATHFNAPNNQNAYIGRVQNHHGHIHIGITHDEGMNYLGLTHHPNRAVRDTHLYTHTDRGTGEPRLNLRPVNQNMLRPGPHGRATVGDSMAHDLAQDFFNLPNGQLDIPAARHFLANVLTDLQDIALLR